MMDKVPAVSVIIPTYNNAWSLQRCIKSVLDETSSMSIETIIVDDGSTDDTPKILKEFSKEILSIRKHNEGPGSARNLGASIASSEYIAFLDADDCNLNDRFLMQHDYMRKHPDVVLTFGAVNFMSSPEVPYLSSLEIVDEWRILENAYRHLMTCGAECVNTPTVMVPRKIFLDLGGFDTRYRCGEDTDLWVRLAELGPFAYHGRPMALVNDVVEEGKLTKSKYVYTDGPKALLEILKRDTKLSYLSYEDKVIATHLVKMSVEMMLRYDWTHLGRGQMLADLELCSPVFGPWFQRKWKLISFLSPQLGRIARKTKNVLKKL